jgi:glycogen debranching enzyme
VADTPDADDRWRVAAGAARADDRTRVLKHDDTFGVFDRYGDIQATGLGEEGLYHLDTRFLCRELLLVDRARPLFLSSTVKDDSSLFIVEAMNPDLYSDGQVAVAKGALHFFRARLLWNPLCFEHIRIVNYGMETVTFTLAIALAADFVDIFEVRGTARPRRGTLLPVETSGAGLLLAYRGLDGLTRRTRIHVRPRPARTSSSGVEFELTLAPGVESHVYVDVACEIDGQPATANLPVSYADALQHAQREGEHNGSDCRIRSPNEVFNRWLDRSRSDLYMLTTRMREGPYPYAGVPWFATEFGRDGIITAREFLWVDPSLARGVLAHLAATQAREKDPARDAEPGKILHEARHGEMAILREIPFGRYYGTVDATPLFVALAGAYHARTGDLDFIRGLWPQVCAALDWMDRYGDVDGDGFIEYARRSKNGLDQQGWKDSRDSISHRDGTFAEGPIALCEVQGYAYEAKVAASGLARLLGDEPLANALDRSAAALREAFDRAFWNEDLGSYVLALDGEKRQCVVAASNAGHCLWTGIARPERASAVAARLLGEPLFSGWGVRTLARGEARYNPMSYHNGSVWPHDNALIAAGLARYGLKDEAMRIFEGLFAASGFSDENRLPELFCGFPRRNGEGPTLYPVACSPQAWAAAAVFYLVDACLGIDFEPQRPAIKLQHPRLPPFLDRLEVRNLEVNGARAHLILERYRNNVGVNVLGKDPGLDVMVLK